MSGTATVPSGIFGQTGERVDPLDVLGATNAALKGHYFACQWNIDANGFNQIISDRCDPNEFLGSLVISQSDATSFRDKFAPPRKNRGIGALLFSAPAAKPRLPPSCPNFEAIERQETDNRLLKAKTASREWWLKSYRTTLDTLRRQLDSKEGDGGNNVYFLGLTLKPGQLPIGEGIEHVVRKWETELGRSQLSSLDQADIAALNAEWNALIAEVRARDTETNTSNSEYSPDISMTESAYTLAKTDCKAQASHRPQGNEGEAWQWLDVHYAKYDVTSRGEKTRMDEAMNEALSLGSSVTAKTYRNRWYKARNGNNVTADGNS
ncbi:MAG: hypothetical protein HQL37_06915 [Alphaproteobacteria bacterium]|nr:hypothetical protein [Alphaproteobacteria bacterium]